MREFSASRHFFKTNVTQSVAELILYSQKTRNCGHFLSKLVIILAKNYQKLEFLKIGQT